MHISYARKIKTLQILMNCLILHLELHLLKEGNHICIEKDNL